MILKLAQIKRPLKNTGFMVHGPGIQPLGKDFSAYITSASVMLGGEDPGGDGSREFLRVFS